MYEKLSGKNFTDLEGIEDIDILLYCSFVCSTGMKITLDAFNLMLEDEKFAKDLFNKWDKIGRYLEQFQKDETPSEGEGKQGDEPHISLTHAANTLIFDFGLDADYVLNKMDLWELELLFKGAEEQYHNAMEDKRLWAYLNMLPNVDKKHSHSFTPQKMLEFPWEKKVNRAKAEKELQREKKNIDRIIGMNIDDLLNGKGRTDNSLGREGSREDGQDNGGTRED